MGVSKKKEILGNTNTHFTSKKVFWTEYSVGSPLFSVFHEQNKLSKFLLRQVKLVTGLGGPGKRKNK